MDLDVGKWYKMEILNGKQGKISLKKNLKLKVLLKWRFFFNCLGIKELSDKTT